MFDGWRSGWLWRMVFMKIKICGITREDEIELLNELGVDYAGFVLFFDKSRRNVDFDRAVRLKNKLKNTKAVAVVVEPTLEQARAIEEAGFDVLQVHGRLSEDIEEKCKITIWKALNVKDNQEEAGRAEIEKLIKNDRISAIVMDAANAGSGETFDWDIMLNEDFGTKDFVLAGGLNPINVGSAIQKLDPDVVDVSSGVEYTDRTIRGKDAEKVIKFVENTRNTLR